MIKRNSRSRKGQQLIITSVLIIVGLFVLGIVSIIANKIMIDVKPDINADLTTTEANATLNDVADDIPSSMSGVFMFVFLGFWMVCLVVAYNSSDHPMIFGMTIILLVFVVILSMYLGNSFEEFFLDSEYSTATTGFDMPTWILSHMMEMSIMVLFSSVVVAFVKSRSD